MGLLLDSFWRAAGCCLKPRVLAASLLPLAAIVLLACAAGWLFWAPAVSWARDLVGHAAWLEGMGGWIGRDRAGQATAVVAPLLVIVVAGPALLMGGLLATTTLMMPMLLRWVSACRFSGLERKRGASLLASLAWALGSVLAALLALVVTLPLWLLPPLMVLLPPLILGWLNYRVMAFDALAEHASRQERVSIFRRHRWPLLAIGVACSVLGAAPGVVWISGWLFLAAFVVLVPLAAWIYTLVFVFSALWFIHYCLAALAQLRSQSSGPAALDRSSPVPTDHVLPS